MQPDSGTRAGTPVIDPNPRAAGRYGGYHAVDRGIEDQPTARRPVVRPAASPIGAGFAAGDATYLLAASAASAPTLLGGVWLVVSRLVMNFRDVGIGLGVGAVWSGVTVGVAVTLIALARLATIRSDPTLSLVNVVLAGWVMASPWVFGYAQFGIGSGPGWSDVIAGAVIAASSLSSWLAAITVRRATGGYPR